MMLRFVGGLLIATAIPLSAQVFPKAQDDRQRLKEVYYEPGREVVLTMLPQTPLVVVLDPRERISEIEPGPEGGFTVRVSAERDSFTILPLAEDARSSLSVKTSKRQYRFLTTVSYAPEAAVLVRFQYGNRFASLEQQAESDETWRYRLRGDQEVRPQDITDDGVRTRITYAPGQPLPAVFAIGPTGDEEVVNGYMRGDVYEIDRVYEELVFRIDKEKATARRNDQPEAET